jgi:hypothetical protein
MQLPDSGIDCGTQIDVFIDLETIKRHGQECCVVARAMKAGINDKKTQTSDYMGCAGKPNI